MAPKKLTEADKTSILSLYRQPQETTSTLAERYGVSNSTISRLLKASLPDAEYSILIQQKRSSSDRDTPLSSDQPEALIDKEPTAQPRGRKKVGAAAVRTETVAEDSIAELGPGAKAGVKIGSKAKPRSKKQADLQLEPRAADGVAEGSSLLSPSPADTKEGSAKTTKPTRRRRLRDGSLRESQATDAPPQAAEVLELVPDSTQLSLPEPNPVEAPTKPARPVLKSAQVTPAETLEVEADLDDDDNDNWDDPVLGDDYDDDDGDDSDDDDAAYLWESGDSPSERLRNRAVTHHPMETLEIFPLTADVLPPLCYVVVERTSSELVVLPLRTFAELGQIPEEEGESRTLPVFENHNVARRFSRRNQRVVKVPDGTLLQTTSAYLQAKGITRLFIDGQVFSLGQDPVEPMAARADE